MEARPFDLYSGRLKEPCIAQIRARCRPRTDRDLERERRGWGDGREGGGGRGRHANSLLPSAWRTGLG